MGRKPAETALEKILSWVKSIPSDRVDLTVNNKPDVNSSNPGYLFDYEIRISPLNPNSLGITIWISDDALGFFIGSFLEAARLLKVRVKKSVADFTCSGIEPVTYISTASIIKICKELSSSRLPLHGLVMNGMLKGTYSKVSLANNEKIVLSSGVPSKLAKAYTYFRLAEIRHIPYEEWM